MSSNLSEHFNQTPPKIVMNLIVYDSLPLDINNRKNDQILTLNLTAYGRHTERALNAVLLSLKNIERPVMCIITQGDSTDYKAFSLGYPAQLCASRLFDIFMQVGLFQTPTHGTNYPSHII